MVINNVSLNEILFIVRQRPPTFFYRQPEFNSRLLKLDALTLKNYYHSKGFLDVKIKESHKITNSKADIIFEIDEGIRYYLSDLKINGNKSISDDRISELLGFQKENHTIQLALTIIFIYWKMNITI